MIKKLLKRIPIIKRIYPSIIKKIYNYINTDEINYEYFGLKLKGNIKEPMDKEIFLFSEYEHLQIDYLLKLMKESKFDYFIDVGANSGLYSMVVAKNDHKIKIKSFEPIKKTILKFKKNIQLNKNINNIEIELKTSLTKNLENNFIIYTDKDVITLRNIFNISLESALEFKDNKNKNLYNLDKFNSYHYEIMKISNLLINREIFENNNLDVSLKKIENKIELLSDWFEY